MLLFFWGIGGIARITQEILPVLCSVVTNASAQVMLLLVLRESSGHETQTWVSFLQSIYIGYWVFTQIQKICFYPWHYTNVCIARQKNIGMSLYIPKQCKTCASKITTHICQQENPNKLNKPLQSQIEKKVILRL